MADHDRDEHEGGGGFMMGLLTGTVLGAGLGMLLAPKRGSELRNQLTEGASSLGRRAGGAVSEMSDRARETVHRVGERTRGRAADTSVGPKAGTGFGSGVGLSSTETMSPAPGGSTSSTGSTYTGTPGGFDPDRP